jgi:hypothetical protein
MQNPGPGNIMVKANLNGSVIGVSRALNVMPHSKFDDMVESFMRRDNKFADMVESFMRREKEEFHDERG